MRRFLIFFLINKNNQAFINFRPIISLLFTYVLLVVVIEN